MKQYKVTAESEYVDFEAHYKYIEHAMEMYTSIRNDDLYNKGEIMDNATGEVYTYFFRIKEYNGTMTREWQSETITEM